MVNLKANQFKNVLISETYYRPDHYLDDTEGWVPSYELWDGDYRFDAYTTNPDGLQRLIDEKDALDKMGTFIDYEGNRALVIVSLDEMLWSKACEPGIRGFINTNFPELGKELNKYETLSDAPASLRTRSYAVEVCEVAYYFPEGYSFEWADECFESRLGELAPTTQMVPLREYFPKDIAE